MHALEPSCELEIPRNHPGITTLLLFDYDCAEPPEGESVFSSIRTCLQRSQGVCALSDTGVFSAGALVKLTRNARCTRTVAGGVVGTRKYRSMAPSVAAMWTDRPENVELFHDYLNLHTSPRYQGAVLLADDVSYGDFLGFCARWSCAATTAGASRLQRIIGVMLNAGQGLGECWQLLYTRVRQRCSGSCVHRAGASIGVLLVIGLGALLFARDAARDVTVAPVAGQNARDETRPQSLRNVVEPVPKLIPGVGAGNSTPAGLQTENYPQGKKLPNPRGTHRANQESALAGVTAAPFTVQVGSFRNGASAAGLVGRLNSRGYLAFVSIAKLSDGQTTHRVRVGGFRTRSTASAFGEELKQRESFITGFFVAVNK